MCDRPHNASFCSRIESTQYDAALAITVAIMGTSRERFYQELCLESLPDRRKIRRLNVFFKIDTNEEPLYSYKLIAVRTNFYNTHNNEQIPEIPSRNNFFKNSFFPNAISERSKLDKHICKSKSYSVFRNSLLSFLRPPPNNVFAIHNIN